MTLTRTDGLCPHTALGHIKWPMVPCRRERQDFHCRTIPVHSSSHESRPGPVRAGPGSAHGIFRGYFAHAYPVWAPGGICMGACGLERAARTGPIQIPVQVQSNPVHCPDWARNGQVGLTSSNPVRALAWAWPGSLSG